MASLSNKNQCAEIRHCVDWAKRFVMSLWGKIPKDTDADDLFGAALLGLAESIKRYEPNKEAKLRTYAKQRMVGAVKDELRRQDPLSRNQRTKLRHLRSKKPTDNPACESFSDPKENEELNRLEFFSNQRRPIHVDFITSPIQPHSDIWPDEAYHKNHIRRLIKTNLMKLGSRERRVLELLYYHDFSTVEVGRKLGVSQSRISQIRSESLATLRNEMKTAVPRAA